jgi:hypothetical protein
VINPVIIPDPVRVIESAARGREMELAPVVFVIACIKVRELGILSESRHRNTEKNNLYKEKQVLFNHGKTPFTADHPI